MHVVCHRVEVKPLVSLLERCESLRRIWIHVEDALRLRIDLLSLLLVTLPLRLADILRIRRGRLSAILVGGCSSGGGSSRLAGSGDGERSHRRSRHRRTAEGRVTAAGQDSRRVRLHGRARCEHAVRTRDASEGGLRTRADRVHHGRDAALRTGRTTNAERSGGRGRGGECTRADCAAVSAATIVSLCSRVPTSTRGSGGCSDDGSGAARRGRGDTTRRAAHSHRGDSDTNFTQKREKKDKKGIKSCITIYFIHCTTPVSMIHLDLFPSLVHVER